VIKDRKNIAGERTLLVVAKRDNLGIERRIFLL